MNRQMVLRTGPFSAPLTGGRMGTTMTDPELLYAECESCGQPVLWRQGVTRDMLSIAHVDTRDLDAGAVVLASSCPRCDPERRVFQARLVHVSRLASHLSPHLFTEAWGNG